MDITGQMEIEILHRDHLRISAAGCATFDAKSWTLRGLPDGSYNFLS